jgi:hypothetical protein
VLAQQRHPGVADLLGHEDPRSGCHDRRSST